MYVHEALTVGLLDLQVETLFGLMGDGNLYFADSFARREATTFVRSVHEAGAVSAAAGYAGVTGRLGVATVTHGPGLTNALTPLVDAVRGNVPLVLISGNTSTRDTRTPQRTDQHAWVRSAGAEYIAVPRADCVVRDLARAVATASLRRTPVVLDVPIDMMWEEVDYTRPDPTPMAAAMVPHADALDEALGIVASAARPLILAGKGAVIADAHDELLALAQTLGAPMATTLKASSFFRGDPGDLGVFGTLSSERALEAIGAADCILAFGASLNEWTTDSHGLIEGKSVVHCDVEPAAFGRHLQPTARVMGDARSVASAMTELLHEAEVSASGFRARWTPVTQAAASVAAAGDEELAFVASLQAVDAAFEDDRVVVVDAGRFMFEGYKHLSIPDPLSLIHTCNFGSIGLAVGHSVGAAVGAPGRRVLAVCGDGGFMMGALPELAVLSREQLDVTIIVINDGGYGAEYVQFERRGMDPARSLLDWPDLSALAAASGLKSRSAGTARELEAALADLVGQRGPQLLELRISPDVIPS